MKSGTFRRVTFLPKNWAGIFGWGPALLLLAGCATSGQRFPASAANAGIEFSRGGIIRGPRDAKKIALEFTGHTFAESGDAILDALARHHAKASFFVTGAFLDNAAFQPLVRRIIAEGHYLGPHSDRHLLYCDWGPARKTLLSKDEFEKDLQNNLEKIRRFGVRRGDIRYWVPAYEWYNAEIAEWGREAGLNLIDYTPGTRSNADYTEEHATNFVSSNAIFQSILNREKEDPNGLNGYLLLMHLGAGPGREDKMASKLGELLDALAAKGYEFVRVDELLNRR